MTAEVYEILQIKNAERTHISGIVIQSLVYFGYDLYVCRGEYYFQLQLIPNTLHSCRWFAEDFAVCLYHIPTTHSSLLQLTNKINH